MLLPQPLIKSCSIYLENGFIPLLWHSSLQRKSHIKLTKWIARIKKIFLLFTSKKRVLRNHIHTYGVQQVPFFVAPSQESF